MEPDAVQDLSNMKQTPPRQKRRCCRRLQTFVLVGLVSFLLGRIASISVCLVGYPQASSSFAPAWKLGGFTQARTGTRPLSRLRRQILDQDEFQALIHQNQNPLRCSGKLRYLIRDEIPPKDGFASEVQYISRLLQVALSTRRILWITENWKSAYCPPGRKGRRPGGDWACLWQSPTNCSLPSSSSSSSKGNNHPTNRTLLDTALSPMNYGILPQRKRSLQTSPWFDPLLYSTRPMLPAHISFPLKNSAVVADVIPQWERIYGRYWIRSQMAHYLWQPAEWLAKEMKHRLTFPTDRPFIGIHVRFTDNIPDFAKSFGRNATYTRQLDHFWEIANQIAHEHNSQSSAGGRVPIRDLYIATDHAQVLDWARTIFVGWTVWGQDTGVQRSTTQSRIWFAKGRGSAAAAMAADLEVLRRADYLLGSFQSNVFRLAAQLNTAWNVHRYSVRTVRHFTVDVEWFEDP